MRAITLWQPWATLVAIGAKRIETRSWPIRYRGPIAVHAAKRIPPEGLDAFDQPDVFRALVDNEVPWADIDDDDYMSRTGWKVPLGAIIAFGRIVHCSPISGISSHGHTLITLPGQARIVRVPEREVPFGDYGEGRYAWLLQDVEPIKPIPCRGYQGLWTWNPPDMSNNDAAQGRLFP